MKYVLPNKLSASNFKSNEPKKKLKDKFKDKFKGALKAFHENEHLSICTAKFDALCVKQELLSAYELSGMVHDETRFSPSSEAVKYALRRSNVIIVDALGYMQEMTHCIRHVAERRASNIDTDMTSMARFAAPAAPYEATMFVFDKVFGMAPNTEENEIVVRWLERIYNTEISSVTFIGMLYLDKGELILLASATLGSGEMHILTPYGFSKRNNIAFSMGGIPEICWMLLHDVMSRRHVRVKICTPFETEKTPALHTPKAVVHQQPAPDPYLHEIKTTFSTEREDDPQSPRSLYTAPDHQVKTRGHNRIYVRRGKHPICPQRLAKLLKAGYSYFPTPDPEWEEVLGLASKGHRPQREDEWMCVKETPIEHFVRWKDKPFKERIDVLKKEEE